MAQGVMEGEAELQRRLLMTPAGDPGGGFARYGAAMFFYRSGQISAEELEVFRICARMDSEDPAAWATSRGLTWSGVRAIMAGDGAEG